MQPTTSPERLVKWLAFVSTPLNRIAAEHVRFYAILYPQLKSAYESAGSPCGNGEEDMWRWWQEQARREQTRWLSQERRRYPEKFAH